MIDILLNDIKLSDMRGDDCMEPVYQVCIADAAIAECCEKRRMHFSREYPGRVDVIEENQRAKMRNCGKCLMGCLKGVNE